MGLIFRISFLIFILTSSVASISASTYSAQQLEDSLSFHLTALTKAYEDNEKLIHSQSLTDALLKGIYNPEIFNHSFSSIKKMAILSPSDKSFMIFNWNIPLNSGHNEFKCFIVVKSNGEDNKVYPFTETARSLKKFENRLLDPDDWYGCLYYDVISTGKKSNQKYTLLGYRPDKMSTKKFVDVLQISKDEVRLGDALFSTKKGTQKRLVFEYSSEVSMNMSYQESGDRIILDHLVPRSEEMIGNYIFYGPDGTFDALQLEKGKWVFMESVDFISSNKSNKVYKDPRFYRKNKKK